MCTVTYIPTKAGFIFTSNRDEEPNRKTINPKYYQESEVNLFYPKDEVAGGTWIGLSEQKRLVCLLNGGFVYHNPKLKFPKSRGLVVKQLLTTENLLNTIDHLDLSGVAPFTLIVVDWSVENKIYELVWCKEEKHVNELDSNSASIWSSSTLYTREVKILRKEWLRMSGLDQYEVDENKVLNFHQNEDLGNQDITLKMKRDVVQTVSTTMIVKEDLNLNMKYFDYVKDEDFRFANVFSLVKV